MRLTEMSSPAVDRLSRDVPVVIPIAAVEQHGEHLPLYTDSMLLGEVVRRAELKTQADMLLAPLQWYGNSHHHMDFPGTLSAPPRVYLDILNGIVENFISHGFKRILLINGHGGNSVPGQQAMFEIRQHHRERNDLLLLFSTYWSLGGNPNDRIDNLQQMEMAHACEWETSMMMCIAPQLVGNYQSAEVVSPNDAFEPASRAWITKDRSEVGHIGSPHLATEEKGEALLSHFANGLVSLLVRMANWNGVSWED